MSKLQSTGWILGVFTIASFVVVNYTLNHFYVNGAYMMDSGHFAYLSAHAVAWPLSNPPAIGGTYFSIHFSPAFYLFTVLHRLLNALGLELTDVTWFSITQGLWLGITAASVFALLSYKKPSAAIQSCFNAAVSLVVTFNGVFLAALGFPHFEMAIPALLVAFFASHLRGHTKLAISFLCIGLLMREDAGLHYFGLFFLLAIYLYWAGGRLISADVRFYSTLAVSCLAYGVLVILGQKLLFGGADDSLSRVYLGDPALSHLSPHFLEDRLTFFAQERLYILAPIILALSLSVIRRNGMLLVGFGAVVPWVLFSLLAVSLQAGTLTSYYAFPVAIALCWPAVSYALGAAGNTEPSTATHITKTDVSLIALSSLLLFPGSSGHHDPSPWQDFGPKWLARNTAPQSALQDLIEANAELDFFFDDAVASLLSSSATRSHWDYNLAFSPDEINAADAIVFQPRAWLADRVKEVAYAAEFGYLCQIPNTHFAVLSRLPRIARCLASDHVAGTAVNPQADLFSYFLGWSHKEPTGRWTVGDRVALPGLLWSANSKLSSYETLCFQGNGFLPNPSSQISVKAYLGDSFLGQFEFTASNPEGERCIPARIGEMPAPEAGNIRLRLSGYSSPASHGVSADQRPLGIFVKAIYFK